MNKSLLGAEKATEAAGESCQWEDFTLLLIKQTKDKAALRLYPASETPASVFPILFHLGSLHDQ